MRQFSRKKSKLNVKNSEKFYSANIEISIAYLRSSTLGGLNMKNKRIPQQGGYIYSFFVHSFSLSFRWKFSMFKNLYLSSWVLHTPSCAPIQCTVWLHIGYADFRCQVSIIYWYCNINSNNYSYRELSLFYTSCSDWKSGILKQSPVQFPHGKNCSKCVVHDLK